MVRFRTLAFVVAFVLAPFSALADWTLVSEAQLVEAADQSVIRHEWTTATDSTAYDISSCRGSVEARFDPSTGDSSTDATVEFRLCRNSTDSWQRCRAVPFINPQDGTTWSSLNAVTQGEGHIIARALTATTGGDTARAEVRCTGETSLTGGGGGGGGNLGTTATGSALTITNTGGTNASIPAATTTTWGALTDEDKTLVDALRGGVLESNGDIVLGLDQDNNGVSSVRIRNGADADVFTVTELGGLQVGDPTQRGTVTLFLHDMEIDGAINSAESGYNGLATLAIGAAGVPGNRGALFLLNFLDSPTTNLGFLPALDMDTDVVLTFPPNDGDADQVMTTDGSGVLSWTGRQPLDSDLTSIAALTTTAHGRGLLDDADPAASRTSIGANDAANLSTGTIPAARVGAGHIDAVSELATSLCTGNQILKKNAGNTAWECAADASGGGGIAGSPLTECFTLYAPTAEIQDTDDVKSWWRAPAALTITEVWCETEGAAGATVVTDVQLDDGTPADVTASVIGCDEDGETRGPLSVAMASGNTLDLAITAVVSNPTRFSVCVNYDFD